MLKLTDIKTELFTRTTLTDYGVRFESFDKEEWIRSGSREEYRHYYMVGIHILISGGINITAIKNNHINIQQLDEIHRVSKLLREEK